jgi:hypothetical protein
LEEKLQKKISGFINFIYWIYFTTGFLSSLYMFKDAELPTLIDKIVCPLIIIMNTVFWLPMKIAETFYK